MLLGEEDFYNRGLSCQPWHCLQISNHTLSLHISQHLPQSKERGNNCVTLQDLTSLYGFHYHNALGIISLIVSFHLTTVCRLKERKNFLELLVVPTTSVTWFFAMSSQTFWISRCLNKQTKFQKKSSSWAGNSRPWHTFNLCTTVALFQFIPSCSLCLASLKLQSLQSETDKKIKNCHKTKLKTKLYKNSDKYDLISFTVPEQMQILVEEFVRKHMRKEAEHE